nr:MAG TPA: hypothetical protein [Caudoviricetes sp.]
MRIRFLFLDYLQRSIKYFYTHQEFYHEIPHNSNHLKI